MYLVFLYYVIKVGMDMGIVNVGMIEVYEDIFEDLFICVEDVFFNCWEDVIECLMVFVEQVKGDGGCQIKCDFSWCEGIVEECFLYVLVKGIIEYIEEDMEEVCQVYDCLL